MDKSNKDKKSTSQIDSNAIDTNQVIDDDMSWMNDVDVKCGPNSDSPTTLNSSEMTYSCPKCSSGLRRDKDSTGVFKWFCIAHKSCNSIYFDHSGKPSVVQSKHVSIYDAASPSVSSADYEFDLDDYDVSSEFDFEELPTTESIYPDQMAEEHSKKLIAGIVEVTVELYETYKDSIELQQEIEQLQSKFDKLEKYRNHLSKHKDALHDEYTSTIKSKFWSKQN